MIDLADIREEMLQYCSEITASELQELMDSCGYEMVIRDRLPGEVDESDEDCEGAIMEAASTIITPKYWSPSANPHFMTPQVALVHYLRNEVEHSGRGTECSRPDWSPITVQYALSEHESWDASFLIQGSFAQDVTVIESEEMISTAANNSELALAA